MSKCVIEECKICNLSNVININKTLLFKILPIYQCTDLYDGLLLPELIRIIIDYVCELSKVTFTRLDFLDVYVGWTAHKTMKLLRSTIDKIIVINNTHTLIQNKGDAFGFEAIATISSFISQNKEIIIIFN